MRFWNINIHECIDISSNLNKLIAIIIEIPEFLKNNIVKK